MDENSEITMKNGFCNVSAWRAAFWFSWVVVLGGIGWTAAEISQFAGITQFTGTTLRFTWTENSADEHYRLFLTETDYTKATDSDTTIIAYTDSAAFEIPVLPGYAYRLKVQAVNPAGDASPVSEESPQYLCLGASGDAPAQITNLLPVSDQLGPGFPNPFNLSTTIPFQIASRRGGSADVSLRIYNTLGQVVRDLLDAEMQPGQYRAEWDGRNNQGLVVSAGTYICRLQVDDWSAARLLVLAK
jgi:hypothetical protein